MNLTGLLIFLAIGAVAGWLAGVLMKGRGFGLLGDMVIGIVGAVVGGYVSTRYSGRRAGRVDHHGNRRCRLAAVCGGADQESGLMDNN